LTEAVSACCNVLVWSRTQRQDAETRIQGLNQFEIQRTNMLVPWYIPILMHRKHPDQPLSIHIIKSSSHASQLQNSVLMNHRLFGFPNTLTQLTASTRPVSRRSLVAKTCKELAATLPSGALRGKSSRTTCKARTPMSPKRFTNLCV